MLDLKVIWSLSAIFAMSVALFQGAPKIVWGFLAVFVVFFYILDVLSILSFSEERLNTLDASSNLEDSHSE